MTCTVQNLPSKIVKLQEETFKLKRFLRLQQIQNPGIDDSHLLTSSCTTYCLTIPRRQLQSKEKLLDSITNAIIRTLYRRSLMKSYSAAFNTKRHMKHSRKLTMVCAKLTNPDPSDGMWHVQPRPELGDQLRRLSYYWPKIIPDAIAYAKQFHACQIHGDFSIKHQVIFIQRLLCGHLRCREWCHWNHKPLTSKGHQFFFVITDYFSK